MNIIILQCTCMYSRLGNGQRQQPLSALCVLSLLCVGACGSDANAAASTRSRVPDDFHNAVLQVADPQTAALQARARAELAPQTLSAAMSGGRCETQADCTGHNVCLAVAPGMSQCTPNTGFAVPRAAPNGRPAPPIGLLDGQVLRDYVRGGRP